MPDEFITDCDDYDDSPNNQLIENRIYLDGIYVQLVMDVISYDDYMKYINSIFSANNEHSIVKFDEIYKINYKLIELMEYPIYVPNLYSNTNSDLRIKLSYISAWLCRIAPDDFPAEIYFDIVYTMFYAQWKDPYLALSMNMWYWKCISG